MLQISWNQTLQLISDGLREKISQSPWFPIIVLLSMHSRSELDIQSMTLHLRLIYVALALFHHWTTLLFPSKDSPPIGWYLILCASEISLISLCSWRYCPSSHHEAMRHVSSCRSGYSITCETNRRTASRSLYLKTKSDIFWDTFGARTLSEEIQSYSTLIYTWRYNCFSIWSKMRYSTPFDFWRGI